MLTKLFDKAVKITKSFGKNVNITKNYIEIINWWDYYNFIWQNA